MRSRLRNRLFISCRKELARLEGRSDPSCSGIPGSALGPRDRYRDTSCGFLQSLPVSAWIKVKLCYHHFVTYAVDGKVAAMRSTAHLYVTRWQGVVDLKVREFLFPGFRPSVIARFNTIFSSFVTVFDESGWKGVAGTLAYLLVLLLPRISGSQSFSLHGDICASAICLRRP
jgi:hypothetical protein